MNRDNLQGKWRQVRGRVKQQWGRLTDDELDQIAGSYDVLVGKIQEKYGESREEIDDALGRILDSERTPSAR